MTYTKRQWFIYRLNQTINLLIKVDKYMEVIERYVDKSKYSKGIKKIHKRIFTDLVKLEIFREIVDSKEVE